MSLVVSLDQNNLLSLIKAGQKKNSAKVLLFYLSGDSYESL